MFAILRLSLQVESRYLLWVQQALHCIYFQVIWTLAVEGCGFGG